MLKKTPLVLAALVALAVAVPVLAAGGPAPSPATLPAAGATAVAPVSISIAQAPLDAFLVELDSAQAFGFGCPTTGGCDTDLDCFRRNYYCPLGSPKACFQSSGTGSCDGYCGCCP